MSGEHKIVGGSGFDWQVWYHPEKDLIALCRAYGMLFDYKFVDGIQFSPWSPLVLDFVYVGEFE